MKRHVLFFPALALLLSSTPLALAQESASNGPAIKSTTLLNADGTRTDTQKNYEEGISERKTYSSSDGKKLISRMLFRLDEQGREVEGTLFDARGRVVSKITRNYDANGFLAEEIEKNPQGAVLRRQVFRHATGTHRITSVEVYDGEGRRISPEGGDMPQGRKKTR